MAHLKAQEFLDLGPSLSFTTLPSRSKPHYQHSKVDFKLLQQIRDVLTKDLRTVKIEGSFGPFECQEFLYAQITEGNRTRLKVYTLEERRTLLSDFCWRLYNATNPPADHFANLDAIYTELLVCHTKLREGQTEDQLVNDVYSVLRRLPRRPISFPQIDVHVSDDYMLPLSASDKAKTSLWNKLIVTSSFATNVIRAAIVRCTIFHIGLQQNHVNITAELLEMCSKLEQDTSSSDENRGRWFVVRSFLWTVWQRVQMIYYHSLLGSIIDVHGVDEDYGTRTYLRGTVVAPGISSQQLSDKLAYLGKADYMCTWAFNLLRTDSIAIGSDFRAFHERYSRLHGSRPARCNRGYSTACDGEHSDNCQRFRMQVDDQSQHDDGCNGTCPKLIWDETDYRSFSGNHAVDIRRTDLINNVLKYCHTSRRTLAISHVWCHGQGGRPENGMNRCLHQRYVELAKEMGCTSYFMDTPCIPWNAELRKEAIRTINPIFEHSGCTLVIDKDLLEIDVSDLTVELKECILVTLLVSDWNVRAWTLLEAMRGRKNLRLLCRDHEHISLNEIIRDVYNNGNIDVAILALLTPQLLPWSKDDWDESIDKPFALTDATIEMAGTLLSYRPASHSRDDSTIWSLMVARDGSRPKDAEDFWRQQVGEMVRPGYLMSSAPRLEAEGLSWAPATPYAAPREEQKRLQRKSAMPRSSRSISSGLASTGLTSAGIGYGQGVKITSDKFYRAFSGAETPPQRILKEGLVCPWFIHTFDGEYSTFGRIFRGRHARSQSASLTEVSSKEDEFSVIRENFLSGYRYGALVQPYKEMAGSQDQIARYAGRIDGTLVAVLGSNRQRKYINKRATSLTNRDWHDAVLYDWKWLGVYEWPSTIPLPVFEAEMVWIA